MLASILIGLDPFYHNDERMDAIIQWAKPSGPHLGGPGCHRRARRPRH